MFFRVAVYHGCQNEPDEQASWNATFENLWWLLHRIGEKYLEGKEYNAYKHGLRIMATELTLAASANPNDFSNAFVMRSPYSIRHLTFTPTTEGTTVSIETKAFSPTESIAHVRIMADILTAIKRIRYAAITGNPRVEVTLFPSIDRAGLQELAAFQRWVLPVRAHLYLHGSLKLRQPTFRQFCAFVESHSREQSFDGSDLAAK